MVGKWDFETIDRERERERERERVSVRAIKVYLHKFDKWNGFLTT